MKLFRSFGKVSLVSRNYIQVLSVSSSRFALRLYKEKTSVFNIADICSGIFNYLNFHYTREL